MTHCIMHVITHFKSPFIAHFLYDDAYSVEVHDGYSWVKYGQKMLKRLARVRVRVRQSKHELAHEALRFSYSTSLPNRDPHIHPLSGMGSPGSTFVVRIRIVA